MSDLIQWPRAQYWDRAWNPVIGCNPISPACANCYAKAWAQRFGQSFEPHVTKQKPPRKGVVFCGNMTDLFGEWIPSPENYIKATGEEFVAPTATYLYLTKRVKRLCRALCNGLNPEYEPIRKNGWMARNYSMWHHYFGFTAENQECYDRRIKDFRGDMPTWVNGWLSAEPLLGPIDLGLRYIAPEDAPFKWVVVGCESGPNRRPCKIEWVESIVDQCRAANVPVFVKQLDLNGKCERDITKFPKHLQIRQVPWAKNGGAR